MTARLPGILARTAATVLLALLAVTAAGAALVESQPITEALWRTGPDVAYAVVGTLLLGLYPAVALLRPRTLPPRRADESRDAPFVSAAPGRATAGGAA